MPFDAGSWLVIILTAAVTFLVARLLSRNYRKRRREREDAAGRVGESRQVRRARERRDK
jgi:hypothetical protein